VNGVICFLKLRFHDEANASYGCFIKLLCVLRVLFVLLAACCRCRRCCSMMMKIFHRVPFASWKKLKKILAAAAVGDDDGWLVGLTWFESKNV
jgi:hypothetical protein